MKSALGFLIVVSVAIAALYVSQQRPQSPPVSPNTVLGMAADVQRDVTRLPMRLTRLTDQQEIAFGDELAARYAIPESDFSPQEAALVRYVRQVGGVVALHAHRKLHYRFHLIPDRSMINAFALPGGHVFVGEGILDLMNSEDELANVLAHELEHIDHYHCAERIQIEAQSRKLHLEILGELAQLPLEMWEAGYSKDQEMEADREGMKLAVASSYSPFGAVRIFERFAQLEQEYVIRARTPQQELSQLAVQSLSGYFRSHPLTSERLSQANQVIADEHWQNRQNLKPFRISYEVTRTRAQ